MKTPRMRDKARQAFRRLKFLRWTTKEAETTGGTRNAKCQESDTGHVYGCYGDGRDTQVEKDEDDFLLLYYSVWPQIRHEVEQA